jgi:hypothetical protein
MGPSGGARRAAFIIHGQYEQSGFLPNCANRFPEFGDKVPRLTVAAVGPERDIAPERDPAGIATDVAERPT